MSFFYLYRTQQDSVDSLYLLNDLVSFAKPQYIGIPLSDEEFDLKYSEYTKTVQFREDMKQLDYYILAKKAPEIEKFNGKNHQKLNFRFFPIGPAQPIPVQLVQPEEMRGRIRRYPSI